MAMLVLTRRRDESLVIDGHIVVTVVEIRADRVKRGVTAPRSMPVHRKEIQERIDEKRSWDNEKES
jgi:carbon storage regulator